MFGLQEHRSPLQTGWEKGRREKRPPQPGRELVLEQGPGWQRKTLRACCHSLHPRSVTAFCYGFFAEWDPQSLSVFEACHREQLGKITIHLHLSSADVWEDSGNECHWPDTCGDLPLIRIKEENGETEQRDVAVSLVQSNVISEALAKLPTSAFHRLRLSSGFLISLHHGDVS